MVERYRQYFEEMPCYLSVHDRDLRILEGNRRFREDFGERVGEPCYAAYKGRREACPECPVQRTFEDGESHTSEQELTTQDGRDVAVLVRTTPLHDDAGEIVAVMEMHTDVSEAKALERKLIRNRRRLELLFEEVPCFLTVQGRDLVIQNANRAFRDAFGEAVGEHCFRVYKHRDEPCLVCPALQTFEDGETRDHEEVVTSQDGERTNVLCTTAPIRNAAGDVVAVIEMSTDITQIRQLQSQLTSIGLLVGSISHGIKGLLTGLDGGIYLVNSGFAKDKPERVEQGWDMVQRNVDRIRQMVLDILYYAKDREMEIETIDAVAMVTDIAQGMNKKASDLDVELDVVSSEDCGTFSGDTRAIRAALVNLLENSVDACASDRHKDGHSVQVSVRREPPHVVFDIRDNGIGMDRQTREKLFSLFFSSKGVRGTGLGLFISNKIVDKHGGTIEVESEPGVGSRFVVRLPLQPLPSVRPAEGLS
jgi:PAS domain S-box-containing protein